MTDLRKMSGPPTVIATIVLVVLTYFAGIGYPGADPLLLGLAALAFLAGALAGPVVIERRSWGRAVYFPVQIALTALVLANGPGAMALATMAVISHATLYLKARDAAIVIGAVVAMALACLIWVPDWGTRVGGGCNYLTAVAFVVTFSRIAVAQHDAKLRATRLAQELAVAHDELRATLDKVSELASARERNRIAREVHDGLGHTLTVVHVQLEAARTLVKSDPERAAQIIARMQSVVQGGLRDVRSSVGVLRDTARPPLADAIAGWADELRAEGIAVELELTTDAAPAPAAAHVLYRTTQEALTNVRRHSGARAVTIAIARADRHWRLRIADDGRGAGDLASDVARGHGIAGIRERAEALGGRVAIATEPGRGFELTVDVPAEAA